MAVPFVLLVCAKSGSEIGLPTGPLILVILAMILAFEGIEEVAGSLKDEANKVRPVL